MKISFDYDGVLNAYDYKTPVKYPEQDEPRLGMRGLVQKLCTEGHELWVVTARDVQLGARVIPDLERWDMKKYFANVMWNVKDKAASCSRDGFRIHIDDHPSIIQQFYDSRCTTIPIHFLPGLPSLFDIHVTSPQELHSVIQLFDKGVVKDLRDWKTRNQEVSRSGGVHPKLRISAPDKDLISSESFPVAQVSWRPAAWDKS